MENKSFITLAPGLSKWRGKLLFQLQSASVVLAQRAFSEGRITKFQAQVPLYLYYMSISIS